METKEWIHMDKKSWQRGIWDSEPDKMQFEDPNTKLPCLIVRNASGSLCGYVGVPAEHPWHKRPYEDIGDADVHGGLTFSSFCRKGKEDEAICHVPGPGEPDKVWWLGFDTSHSGDYMPASQAIYKKVGINTSLFEGDTYKDLAYVKKEIASLAKQVIAAVK